MLQSLSSFVRLTQLLSTEFPDSTVGVMEVLQATYKAHAIQCKTSPCKQSGRKAEQESQPQGKIIKCSRLRRIQRNYSFPKLK